MYHCLFTGGLSNSLRQSWFTGDALVSWAWATHVFIVVSMVMCGVFCAPRILKLSSRGRETFVGHCQTDVHMERDSSYRLFCGKEMLDNFGNVLPLGHRELREPTFGEMAVPVIESCPEMSADETVELEKAAGSLWLIFSGNTGEINSSGQIMVSMVREQLRSGGDFATLAPFWEIFQQ